MVATTGNSGNWSGSGTYTVYTNNTTSNTVIYNDTDGLILHDGQMVKDRLIYSEITFAECIRRALLVSRDENGDNSGSIHLPDGTILRFDADGNYKIYDKRSRVVYKANYVREFNRFVNASDLIEQFIRDLGSVGCTQDKILQIPIEVFINWLIVKAAEQDDDEYAARDIPRLEDRKDALIRSRCRNCGRYLSKKYQKAEVKFCNDNCFNKYMEKSQLV